MSTPLPHVLVAEDNLLVCDAMRVLFSETGHRVNTAGHVAEILDIVESDPVDLLLLDLGLADGDGFDVLEQMKSRGMWPRVVVALTGRDELEIVARCLEAGCKAVLLKPVPARELLRQSRDWLATA
ncbi:MAG: response regulator [Gemmatimonadota bacterium]|nr:response regulator [Gemmatimonadota bacterium]